MSAREFLAGHPLAPARYFTRAHDRPGTSRRVRRAPARCPRDEPICRRPSRTPARRSTTTATGPSSPRLPPASSAGAPRSTISSRSRRASDRSSRSRNRDHPAAERLSTALPHPRSGGGRRGRRGGPGSPSQEDGAPPASSTPCFDGCRGNAARCRCRRGRPIRPTATAALDYFEHHALASALARGALVRSARLRNDRTLARVQQHAGAADAASQSAEAHTRGARRPAGSRGRATCCRGALRPDALVVEEGQPLKARGWQTVGSSCRTKRRSSSRFWPVRRPDAACSTPAHRREARRRRWRRPWRAADCWSRAMSASRRIALLRRTVLPARRRRRVRPHRPGGRASSRSRFRSLFDCVLVDAPCSGLGTLRRDPDIRWRRRETDLAALALDQRRMLDHAAACVAPGGRLIYATCSSEPEENDDVVDAFLAESAHFSLVDARTIATAAEARSWTIGATCGPRRTCTRWKCFSARYCSGRPEAWHSPPPDL